MKNTDSSRKTRAKGGDDESPLFLGVDGGGTKTHAILTNAAGEILSEGLATASNPLRVGVENAVHQIVEAADKACDAIGKQRADIAAAQIGLAGVRREDLRGRMREELKDELGVENLEVITDAEIALYGATNGAAGLVIIAGTGSICCGRNDKGEFAVAGGWGPLAGDEGGGAGIARRALQAIAKASDGRGAATKLSDYACKYFRADTPDDLAMAIYAPTMTNDKIAGFTRYVIEAARQSDQVSLDLLDEAGRELGIAANAVIKKLSLGRKKFQVAYVGGVFNAKEMISEPILKKIHETAAHAFIAPPQFPPAVAAAKMAFALIHKKNKAIAPAASTRFCAPISSAKTKNPVRTSSRL
jgi:N-acetylglucosamine kinase-like BadF-type ATPase